MIVIIIAVPVLTFYMLDTFTHHGEKIEVPSVMGKSEYDAEQMLKERGLVCVVTDSAYDKHSAPGSVLEQTPKAGSEVKGGRVVYITVNLKGEPMTKLPDVVSHGSLREAEAMLQALGFKLTPHERIYGRDKDLVVAVKQGVRTVNPGDMVSRDRALTIVVGAGNFVDTLDIENEGTEDFEPEENDFDIEL